MSLKKILRVLLIVGLPLLLTACSNNSGIWSSDVDGNAASANTDISIGFLGQLFGTVGSSLQGYNSQLLGKLFYQFNMGILIVIGAFLIYTVLTSALRGANEGSFVGQGKNVAYNCLKIGLGVAMILPNATTGYCLAQELMMEVTVAGVHLADNVWNTALTYLDSGHAVWSDPNDSSNNVSSIINADSFKAFMGDYDTTQQDNAPSNRLGFNIMYSEVCMLANKQMPGANPDTGRTGDSSTDKYYSRYEFSDGNEDAGCGSVDWSMIDKVSDETYDSTTGSKCVSANSSDDSAQLCQISQNAVLAMINDIIPAATAYYCAQLPATDRASDPNCSAYQNSNYDDDIVNDLYMADIDYTNQIFGAYDEMSLSSSGDFKDAKKSGESDGWMMAGRYYWDMAQKSQASMSGDISEYKATTQGDGTGAIVPNEKHLDYWDDNVIIGTYLKKAEGDAVDYANALDGANSSSTDTSGSNWGNNKYAKWFVGPYLKIISLFTAAGAVANPINWLAQLGQACVAEAGVIWMDTLVAMGLLVLGTASMSCVSPAGYSAETVASWFRPLVLAVAGLLVSAGMVLGYYVPLYPFMIFTFGVIGWFVAVIEAMAAAPLVAFGLTHPEGHDFLGKAEQAVMLALSVFLRPVLMILGLMSGMILSFIAFKMVNYSFCSFMQDLFLGSAVGSASDSSNIAGAVAVAWGHSFTSSGSLFVFLFSLPALLVIYAAIVMEVTHQCYALIYKLPDYIMRWVGAPNTSSPVEVEKLASGVKGAASSAASGVHQGMEKSESRGDSALQRGKEGSGKVEN